MVRVHLRQIPRSATGKRKINFCLNYTPDCTVSSMNFQQISEEGLTEPSPKTPSPAQYWASLSIRASISNLGRFAPSVWASSSIHPNMFAWSFPQQRGTIDKIFWPSIPQLLGNVTVVYNLICRFVIYRWGPGRPGPPDISDKSAPMPVWTWFTSLHVM